MSYKDKWDNGHISDMITLDFCVVFFIYEQYPGRYPLRMYPGSELYQWVQFHTWMLRQNERHFADYIFIYFFLTYLPKKESFYVG